LTAFGSAQQIANHEFLATIKLYDRTDDQNQHHRSNRWYEEGPLKGPLGLTDLVLVLVFIPRDLLLLSREPLAG
jgi:hypothetical protein